MYNVGWGLYLSLEQSSRYRPVLSLVLMSASVISVSIPSINVEGDTRSTPSMHTPIAISNPAPSIMNHDGVFLSLCTHLHSYSLSHNIPPKSQGIILNHLLTCLQKNAAHPFQISHLGIGRCTRRSCSRSCSRQGENSALRDSESIIPKSFANHLILLFFRMTTQLLSAWMLSSRM